MCSFYNLYVYVQLLIFACFRTNWYSWQGCLMPSTIYAALIADVMESRARADLRSLLGKKLAAISIRAKGHRKHQDRQSLQIRGPDRFCVPLPTLRQRHQPDLCVPRYAGAEDHRKTVGDHPGIPRQSDTRADRQAPQA